LFERRKRRSAVPLPDTGLGSRGGALGNQVFDGRGQVAAEFFEQVAAIDLGKFK
jgi:hypothetical protein